MKEKTHQTTLVLALEPLPEHSHMPVLPSVEPTFAGNSGNQGNAVEAAKTENLRRALGCVLKKSLQHVRHVNGITANAGDTSVGRPVPSDPDFCPNASENWCF